jgi:alkylation response protein AidB-like acyl-CoA dehydrogenase
MPGSSDKTDTALPSDEQSDLAAFRARCRMVLSKPFEQLDDRWETARAFQRRLFDEGLAGISIPAEYGGQGLSPDFEEILYNEAAGHHLPTGIFTITLGMCVPVLLQHGTEDQKRRHIPRMLQGDEIWCQLFSEPNAGSDVAGAQLRAVSDGAEWVLNGQKVWTSSAERAAFGMCISRTDPDVPKHRGLTMFIVPMDTPGITVRPLRQATGDSQFNEVFFDDVRLTADALLGAPGRGWAVTISMLMNERTSLGAAGDSLLTGHSDAVFAEARTRGNTTSVERQALADLYIQEQIQRFIALRLRSAAELGRDPGPAGSIAKLAGSDLVRRAATARLDRRGMAGVAWGPADDDAIAIAKAFVHAPSLSIAGGTSEIQRNIIAERVLGLPREPDVDRDIPFRDVKQNRG